MEATDSETSPLAPYPRGHIHITRYIFEPCITPPEYGGSFLLPRPDRAEERLRPDMAIRGDGAIIQTLHHAEKASVEALTQSLKTLDPKLEVALSQVRKCIGYTELSCIMVDGTKEILTSGALTVVKRRGVKYVIHRKTLLYSEKDERVRDKEIKYYLDEEEFENFAKFGGEGHVMEDLEGGGQINETTARIAELLRRKTDLAFWEVEKKLNLDIVDKASTELQYRWKNNPVSQNNVDGAGNLAPIEEKLELFGPFELGHYDDCPLCTDVMNSRRHLLAVVGHGPARIEGACGHLYGESCLKDHIEAPIEPLCPIRSCRHPFNFRPSTRKELGIECQEWFDAAWARYGRAAAKTKLAGEQVQGLPQPEEFEVSLMEHGTTSDNASFVAELFHAAPLIKLCLQGLHDKGGSWTYQQLFDTLIRAVGLGFTVLSLGAAWRKESGLAILTVDGFWSFLERCVWDALLSVTFGLDKEKLCQFVEVDGAQLGGDPGWRSAEELVCASRQYRVWDWKKEQEEEAEAPREGNACWERVRRRWDLSRWN